MGYRQRKITKSIRRGIIKANADSEVKKANFTAYIYAFLRLYYLKLVAFREDLFKSLRDDSWKVDEHDYKDSFQDEDSLSPVGDMGYSGSVRSFSKLIL